MAGSQRSVRPSAFSPSLEFNQTQFHLPDRLFNIGNFGFVHKIVLNLKLLQRLKHIQVTRSASRVRVGYFKEINFFRILNSHRFRNGSKNCRTAVKLFILDVLPDWQYDDRMNRKTHTYIISVSPKKSSKPPSPLSLFS